MSNKGFRTLQRGAGLCGAVTRRRWVYATLTLAVCFLTSLATPWPANATTFSTQITTDRGCLETGQNPVYALGENLHVQFRTSSDTFTTADTTVFIFLPNTNVVRVLQFGTLLTNQTYAYVATAGQPTGVHRLHLQAKANSATATADCSFTVVGAPMTMTPHPTRTPTPTAGPMTPTPTANIVANITTDRGCIETGQNPAYRVGEHITVSFGFTSPFPQSVQATILDILANGFVNVISLGLVQTGATHSFGALIAPPLGVEHLQLKGRTAGGGTAIDTCSFTVVQSGPTRTPMATRTPTPTATPTATHGPINACVSCSGSGPASIDDLITLVKIVFGDLPMDACPSGDLDHDGTITLPEVIVVLAACSQAP